MRRLRAALPLLLTMAGFAAIGALWVRRVASLEGGAARALGLSAGVLYGGWLLWESRVSVREARREGPDEDRGTMELAALAKVSLLVAALAGGGEPTYALGLPGLAVMAGGILIRGSAIRRLGADYSHRIRAPRLPPEASGPYAFVRHPAYLGTLLAHTGVALCFPSTWAAGALLLLWYPAVIVRTVVEERFLSGFPDYAAYAARVRSRLIPGIW